MNNITKFLYVLIVIFLFLDPLWSTIFLFAIVSLWSRIPGTSTAVVGDWLLMLDLVDMFSMIIAINIGGTQGALFSIVVNLVSGATGRYTDWLFVFKDTVAVSLTCLLIPYVHIITGSITVSMGIFVVIRALWYFPMQVIIPVFELPTFLAVIIVWVMGLSIVNFFYTRLFGYFLDSLLKSGVKFNWLLFLVVTIIILGVKIYNKYFNKDQVIIESKNHYDLDNLYMMQ